MSSQGRLASADVRCALSNTLLKALLLHFGATGAKTHKSG